MRLILTSQLEKLVLQKRKFVMIYGVIVFRQCVLSLVAFPSFLGIWTNKCNGKNKHRYRVFNLQVWDSRATQLGALLTKMPKFYFCEFLSKDPVFMAST